MLKTTLSRPVLAVALLATCCGLVSYSSCAVAAQAICSKATLSGDYGFTSEGVLIGVPGLPAEAPFRSVGMAHLDGKGNATWKEHTIIDGFSLAPGWTSATGAYTVNANCTGLLVINTPNSPVPLKLYLTVVKEGNEFHTVLDTDAILSVFTRLE